MGYFPGCGLLWHQKKNSEARKQEMLKLLREVCPGQHGDVLLQVISSYGGVASVDPISPRKHLLLVTFIEEYQSHPLGLHERKKDGTEASAPSHKLSSDHAHMKSICPRFFKEVARNIL